uniref:Uncharacterized protein n=1 Tax=Heterorhabditis bacteriophora TaxID=37862 RepID=A0A1I7X9K2_HETBA
MFYVFILLLIKESMLIEKSRENLQFIQLMFPRNHESIQQLEVKVTIYSS